jgi:hypothetical protein
VHIEIEKWLLPPKMEKKLFVTHAARIREAYSLVCHKNMLIVKEGSKLQKINSLGI